MRLDPRDPAAHRRTIEETCSAIVTPGAIPLALGGDDSASLPVLRVLEPCPDLTVLQIDAPPDWRDEIGAVVAKARLRALAVLELAPASDPEGPCALTAGRIACNASGALLGTRRG